VIGWLVVLASCSEPADPVLEARASASAAWSDGVARLEAGDAEGARARFREARGRAPSDVLLLAWEAKAAADAGALEDAVLLLDEALSREPDLAAARYNKAAYLARLGRIEQAGPELERALDDGAAPPRDVLDDPDFAPWIGRPELAFLPSEALSVAVEVSDALVFWGSDLRLRLRVQGADGPFVSVTPVDAKGPVRLVSVVEDVVPSTDGPVHDITWTFRVVGEGPIVFGALHVWAGARRTLVEVEPVEAHAPPGREEPPGVGPIKLPTPLEVAAQATPPSARVVDGRLLVMALPGDRVEVDPEPGTAPIRYELRSSSKPTWALREWPSPAGAVRVQVRGAPVPVHGPS
jgi:hypothetical protein